MVGGSQLFIGLCIRLDLLARAGYYEKMYEDLLAICEPQLREGPGTIWENTAIDTSSRCHGFTSHFGVHLLRDVLGLGIPSFDRTGDGTRALTIAPHICGLRWARGTHETPDGLVSVSWRYDGESFFLKVSLPAGMAYQIDLPREALMLDGDKVFVVIDEY
jgi:alpha-L-rhamnosidase